MTQLFEVGAERLTENQVVDRCGKIFTSYFPKAKFAVTDHGNSVAVDIGSGPSLSICRIHRPDRDGAWGYRLMTPARAKELCEGYSSGRPMTAADLGLADG